MVQVDNSSLSLRSFAPVPSPPIVQRLPVPDTLLPARPSVHRRQHRVVLSGMLAIASPRTALSGFQAPAHPPSTKGLFFLALMSRLPWPRLRAIFAARTGMHQFDIVYTPLAPTPPPRTKPLGGAGWLVEVLRLPWGISTPGFGGLICYEGKKEFSSLVPAPCPKNYCPP